MKTLCLAASLLLLACSSSDATAPAADGGLTDGGGGGGGPAACSLTAVNGATTVTAELVTVSSTVKPPTLTGGTLSGRFKVTSARVYFPQETAALVDTSKSSGTILAWMVFQGNQYRIHFDIDLKVAVIGATQAQKGSTDSQGTYTLTSGSSFVPTPSCDTMDAGAQSAEYTFQADGANATFLIKTQIPGFNAYSYTELHAVPE